LFQFLWFLTCLYHDAAFHLENDPTMLEHYPTVEALNIGHAIKYKLLDQSIEKINKSLLKEVPAYYKFRHKVHQVTDHGIYAGLLMYDGLVKNRIIQKEKPDKQLYWEPVLDKQYAYVSATVAAHNIWLPKEEEYELYEEHNLKGLIRHEKVIFNDALFFRNSRYHRASKNI
jgi:hypothetical protein